jgi:hypothetical protein
MLSSTSDDDTDVHGAGGFTRVTQRYTYPRLFNLYLGPRESRSYLTRKLATSRCYRRACALTSPPSRRIRPSG